MRSVWSLINCNRRMAEALEGLTGYCRIVDDIVIYDKDPQQHVAHVKQFLEQCKERQIAINKDKWKFCCTRFTFVGFHLSASPNLKNPWQKTVIYIFQLLKSEASTKGIVRVWLQVHRQAREDSDYQHLKQHIMEGFPDYWCLLTEAI